MATATHIGTDVLNQLLRGELAATETYQQALANAGNEAGMEPLRQIHQEHREAANTLRQHVHQKGGEPDQGSGAWGAFAKTITGGAVLIGNAAALKALREGEMHGIKSYEDALKDGQLAPECQELVRTTLLPQTRSHIPVLERLMHAK